MKNEGGIQKWQGITLASLLRSLAREKELAIAPSARTASDAGIRAAAKINHPPQSNSVSDFCTAIVETMSEGCSRLTCSRAVFDWAETKYANSPPARATTTGDAWIYQFGLTTDCSRIRGGGACRVVKKINSQNV
jgi:hypothetical protein